MGAQNPFHQSRAAARQSDDENRRIAAGIFGFAGRRRRKRIDDPLHSRQVVGRVVAHVFAAFFGGARQLLEGLTVLADILVFLGGGVADLHLAAPIAAMPPASSASRSGMWFR